MLKDATRRAWRTPGRRGGRRGALAGALWAAPLWAALCVAAPAEEPTLTPFAARYTADWRTINVGVSELELRSDGEPGHFLYTWTVTARGIFRLFYSDDLVQQSWLSVHGAHVRPDRYRAHEGASSVSLDFDWEAGLARGVSEGKPVELKVPAGTQDLLSIQIEMMLELQNGGAAAGTERTFLIVEKDALKDFLYTQEGRARIRTALGHLDTIVISSHRPGNNRLLRMWFAPSLGYLPVQAERSRDGKLEFAIRITSLRPP